MLNRRSLLLLSSSLLLSQCVTGCNNPPSALKIRLLKGSIPPQIIKEFRRRIAQTDSIKFSNSEQFKDLYALLEAWNPKTAPAKTGIEIPFITEKPESINDLASLGDGWLPSAIQRQMIQPFPDNFPLDWRTISPRWKANVQRNAQGQVDAAGKIWAVPYRLGFLAIAYNSKKLKELNLSLNSWADLWHPALKGLLSLPDSPRAVIGLTLQKLKQSANLENLASLPTLTAELQALHAQAKFYDSEAYLQPLILEDTAIAVGWSSEILPTIRRNPAIAAFIPPSGTLLTADLWVRPATAPALTTATTKQLLDWLQFCWQPDIAAQLALLTRMASPVLSEMGRSQLPTPLQQDPLSQLIQPEPALIAASEFLLSLSDSAIDQYRRQWSALRQTSPGSLPTPG